MYDETFKRTVAEYGSKPNNRFVIEHGGSNG